jgi:phasin protein
MSPHQCRATNNSKPRFQRKHRGVFDFVFIWEQWSLGKMSSSDQQKPGTKSGRRKQKRSQKPDQAPSPVPEQQQAAKELIDATITSTETSSAVAAAMAEPPPAEPPPAAEAPPVAEAAPAETPPANAARPAETSPVGLQTIATAYRDYTRKSIQDAQSYVEKLSGVRSLDKAMEVQTEFAKQAYETFAADSRKICGLYGEFFTQTMRLPKSPFDRAR